MSARWLLLSMVLSGCTGDLGGGEVPAETPTYEAASSHRPLIGAIRWDAWYAGSSWSAEISQPGWWSRLPFYASIFYNGTVGVASDTAEVMAQELAYARAGGVDYWAFDLYHPLTWEGQANPAYPLNRSLDLYLKAADRRGVNYALIVSHAHLGPRGDWDKTVTLLVDHMVQPSYQQVLGGRPLLYAFGMEYWIDWFGGNLTMAQAALNQIRAEHLRRKGTDPYLVLLEFDPAKAATMVQQLGFDAVSSYANPPGSTATERPYSYCAQLNVSFWEQVKARGNKVIPIVNTGWDYRPLIGTDPLRDPSTDWCTQPTATQIAEHLRTAISWTEANPGVAEASTVLVYAWNELSEGGWLVPTLYEGVGRLDAVRKVAPPTGSLSPVRQNLTMDAWVLWGCHGCAHPDWFVDAFPEAAGMDLPFMGGGTVPSASCTSLVGGHAALPPCPPGYQVGATEVLRAEARSPGDCTFGVGTHLSMDLARTCTP